MVISEAEKRVTAIHEAGHALLTVVLPNADPVHKVTIIPRGMALGLTQQLPVDEKHNYSREYLTDQIAILLGGRIAEEVCLGGITTGAGNDLERATELARRMVCEWGMSDEMGPLTFGKKEEQIFLGREIAQHQDYSEDTAVKIDGEVRRIVQENYTRAQDAADAAQGRAAEDRRRTADPRGARRRAGEGDRPGRGARGGAAEGRRPRRSCRTRRRRPRPPEATGRPASSRRRCPTRSRSSDSRPARTVEIDCPVDTFHFGVIRSAPEWNVSPCRPAPRSPSPSPLAHGRSLEPGSAHAGHGHPERHARLLRGRRDGPGRGRRPGAADGGRRGGHHRHRRRVHAARRRRRVRGGRTGPGHPGRSSGSRAAAGARLDRHLQGRRRPGRHRRRRLYRERHQRFRV